MTFSLGTNSGKSWLAITCIRKPKAEMRHPTSRTRVSDRVTPSWSEQNIIDILLMSVSCIAFLRGFFTDKCFVDDFFEIPKTPSSSVPSKTDSIKIKKIKGGVSEEADAILSWINTSIFEALHKRYLKSVNLSIVLDDSKPEELFESYSFDVAYGDSSNESITFNDDVLLTPRELTKIHIFKLLKRFIILTQSLPALPPKRFLYMRLLFNEKCPPEFHLDHFTDCTKEKPASIKVPLSSYYDIVANCGEVDSVHHQISTSLVSNANLTARNFENSKIVELDPFSISCASFNDVSTSVPEFIDSQISQISKDLYKVVKYQNKDNHDGFTQVNCARQQEESVDCSCGSGMYLQYSSIIQCNECNRIMHKVCYSITSCDPQVFKCIDCYNTNSTITPIDMLISFNIRKLIAFLQHSKKNSLKSVKETLLLLGYSANDLPFNDLIIKSVVNAFSILLYQGILSLKTHKSFSHNVFRVDVEGLVLSNSRLKMGKYFLAFVAKNNQDKIAELIRPDFWRGGGITTENAANQTEDETIVEDLNQNFKRRKSTEIFKF